MPSSGRKDQPDGLVRPVCPCITLMMQQMMDGSDMMWGMGLGGLLVLVLVVLAIAALVKYLFFE